MNENKTYLAVLGSLLKWGSRLFRKCRHVSSFEHLIILLRLAELNVRLHSPATKFLYLGKPMNPKNHTSIQPGSPITTQFWGLTSISSSLLTLASLPWFLNWFRRAAFSDIFRRQGQAMKLNVVVFLHTKKGVKKKELVQPRDDNTDGMSS